MFLNNTDRERKIKKFQVWKYKIRSLILLVLWILKNNKDKQNKAFESNKIVVTKQKNKEKERKRGEPYSSSSKINLKNLEWNFFYWNKKFYCLIRK